MVFRSKEKKFSSKHSIIEVIKYDGPNDILIWKFPNEDFNTNTQLIVEPSQEAIFIKGGQVLGRFDSGTHTLDTKNYPFIRSLIGLVTGGVSPFQCSVYYVNKVFSMGIDWGTDTPISIDALISVDGTEYQVPTDIRSYGDFSIQVENGQKLMEKLIGTTYGFSHQEIQRFFGNMMATQVRGIISGTMLEQRLSPIGIDAHLAEMSSAATEKIRPIFEPYGMAVHHFTIAAITAPELEELKQKARDLPGRRIEINITAEGKRTMAQAQAFANGALGITAKEKMVAEMGQTLAGNPGPVVGGTGIVGFPGIVGGNIVQPSAAGTADIARMLMNQAEQPQQSTTQDDFKARADNLQYLLDTGKISKEQYDAKMARMLDEI